MPGNDKYTTYEPVQGAGVLGTSKLSRLAKAFVSPVVMTAAAIKARANEFLLAASAGKNGLQQGDVNMFPVPVNLNYAGSPSIMDVPTGGGGKPGTPFSPNTASPGDGNGDDWTKIPDMQVTPSEINPGYQLGANGTVDPNAVNQGMGEATTVGTQLALGSRPGTISGQEFIKLIK
jgi:hypothetical protein